VTGLLLAALSLRQWHETDNVRFAIPEHSPYLQDYLLTEVLAHLSPARRDWLLLASIPDRFCAPLCEILRPSDAATEETDLTGIDCIRWLQDENLFLVPLDDRDEWFRFHHLFQQLLQDRVGDYLEPEAIAAAHRRAINWFAEKGFIEEAIQHAMAAGDVQTAVQLVEQHRYDLMNREQWHRLERWLNLLPDGAVTQSPLLVCTRVLIATYRGQDSETISSLHRAEHLLTSLTPGTAESEIIQSEIAVVSAVSDVVERRPAQAINRAQSSLEQLPQQALHIRAMAIGAYAVGLQMQGELEQGAAAIRDALAKRAWPEGLQAKMMHYLCVAFDHEGDLASVLTSARAGLWIAEELSVPETLSACRYYLGVAHYVRDELTKAESYLQALLEDRATSTPLYLANGGFFLALIYQAQGRTADAARVIDLLEDYFRETKHSHALAFTTAFRVELTLRQRDLAEARLLSEGVDFEGRLPIWFLYVPHLTPVKLLLAEGTAESLTEAKTRLAVLEAEMRRIHRKNALIEALALQALVYDALGDEPAATEKLAVALALAEPGGFIRTFVDLGDAMAGVLRRYRHESTAGRSAAFSYVDRILAAFPEAATGDRQLATVRAITGPSSPAALSAAEGLIEPLTERESQVLVLLAQRLTYKEIGAQLFISPGTVSQHAVRIYKKLQVKNRRQAVVKAQALGLLPPP
jgi:LuxR family maltose regulon positive regulatory protein